MSLIDDVLAALPDFRAAAESLMLDTCTVHRPGVPVTDADGNVSPSMTLLYTGPCKIQQTLAQSSNPVAGGHRFTVQDTRWDTPVVAGPFQVDDVVTVLGAVLDPQLVGRVFRVTEPFHKSGATAQRTRVEEVSA
ncbi:DUF6093 family protein [Paenarthrobacter sp. NPDC057355]|uniref:DUF6093 family protein n=1 Tax=Paenarthrobacter sp. NPDC057355 TaxID=3346105 RepID=UPI0036362E95